MKKIKNLILLALCAVSINSFAGDWDKGFTGEANEVVEYMTRNGGHVIMTCYSPTYQADEGTYPSMFTDPEGPFVHKYDRYIQDVYGDVTFVKGDNPNVIVAKNLFNGLFDLELDLSKPEYSFYQSSDKLQRIPLRNTETGNIDNTIYGSINCYSYCDRTNMPPCVETPIKANLSNIFERNIISNDQNNDVSDALELWTMRDFWIVTSMDIANHPHDNYDYKLWLNTELGGINSNFFRFAIHDATTGKVLSYKDFYAIEFCHYNPNIAVSHEKNGTDETFSAIGEYIENESADNEFYIYNFSNFGPCFDQNVDDNFKENVLVNGETVNTWRGYASSQAATINPIFGITKSDGNIEIKRKDEQGNVVNHGYVHFERGADDGIAITKWHNCDIAGVETDGEGNILQPLQLKNVVTGKWNDKGTRHHHASDVKQSASNPWVTDGGTCRTMSEIVLDIDPYVYCTDEQFNNNEYDTDDEHGRGGIYRLVKANIGTRDLTLDVAIDNENDKLLQSLMVTTDKKKLACPIEFNATANDQYVDRYELYYYEHKGTEKITDASDEAYSDANSTLNAAMDNATKLCSIEKSKNDPSVTGVANYKTFTISGNDSNGNPIYSSVPMIKLPDGSGTVTITFFIKAVYTEESGLAPTYHSLQNVKEEVASIVTGVDDVNAASVKTVAGVYNINGQFMGTEVPAGNGIYVVRYNDGTATKIAVK